MPYPDHRPGGYLTIDALVALAVTTLTVSAGIGLAAHVVTRVAEARERETTTRISGDLYEDLRAGRRPDGTQNGSTGGKSWSYDTASAATPETRSRARTVRITVDRRLRPDLVVDAVLLPAPDTASSS
jgi:hypothetical protein